MDIYIEGNIGTGKTTFLGFLKQLYPESSSIYEPVDQWTALVDENGKNLLENFYQDQHKWSFAFQMNSFISRIQKVKSSSSELNFIERSVYTDKYCFAENCFKNKKMTKIEYDIYCRWHTWLCSEFKMRVGAFIYLKTEPSISQERIRKRDRKGEAEIPLEYLTELHNLHNTWMTKEIENNTPVLILDVSKDFYNDTEEQKKIKDSIGKFIDSLT